MFVIIRNEKTGDAGAISHVIEKAFRNAPHTSHKEQYIIEKLRQDRSLTLSMLVEDDDLILGYGAISPVAISDGAEHWYGLGPVAIDPACQGQGLGTKLIKALLENLRASGGRGCVVLGEPVYYQRFGFKADKNLIPADVPPPYFLALRLKGAMPVGEVRYHQGFAA